MHHVMYFRFCIWRHVFTYWAKYRYRYGASDVANNFIHRDSPGGVAKLRTQGRSLLSSIAFLLRRSAVGSSADAWHKGSDLPVASNCSRKLAKSPEYVGLEWLKWHQIAPLNVQLNVIFFGKPPWLSAEPQHLSQIYHFVSLCHKEDASDRAWPRWCFATW